MEKILQKLVENGTTDGTTFLGMCKNSKNYSYSEAKRLESQGLAYVVFSLQNEVLGITPTQRAINLIKNKATTY